VSVAHRRVREVLAEHEVAVATVPAKYDPEFSGVLVAEGTIDAGMTLPRLNLTVVGDFELFGHAARRHKVRAAKEGVAVTEADLKVGEYFVHANHGIGQYLGLEHLTIDGVGRDFVQLKYAGADRLYVPIDQMHLIRKYAASDGAAPRLSTMGGSDWARTRSRVREAVEKIAEGLVQLYAERETAQGHAFAPDTPWQAELEESFPYDETTDQRAAIDAAKEDMERPRPMDRLVCGDVGYGKTEVAIRAAFKAIMDRKQVAVLAPTTVLAAQHFRSFSERFSAFPVKIALLSRFRTREQQRESLRGLLDGSVDLVVGTHRLLQKDVGFARLGLVVVDEEQRFGVMHKERLKEMRRSVDVLTLSATPIPRTLHMSMLGVRDLSLIRTPPANRMAIKTVVTPTSDTLIAQALRAELDRGGQVYFVHDRIETIHGVAAAVQRLAPRARIRVGHGQLKEGELESVMIDFVEGRFDVLVSTTIIENGLDIPNVNTIVINNADRFGLAQLYQLRGRVGRSAHQAYAYFLYQPHRALSETAQARLEAIREFSHLGSGLQLAMRDLEIRGAGNLLGRQQHGFIAAVGFDGYCQILQEAIAARRDVPLPEDVPPPVLDIRISAFIPAEYVRGASQKIAYYQRLAAARALEEVEAVADELRDRFGPHPAEVEALLQLSRVRVMAAGKGVEKLALEHRRLTLDVGRRFSLSENALDALTAITRGNFRFTQGAIVAHLPPQTDDGDGRLATVRAIVAAL
jgi:transcription-repair coupling factor (superfamily II helicase)